MQSPYSPQFPPSLTPSAKPGSFLPGLIFGLIFGAASTVVSVVVDFLVLQSFRSLSGYGSYYTYVITSELLSLILGLFSYLSCALAGGLAARRTKRAVSGTWAGLFFGLASRVVNALWLVIMYGVINHSSYMMVYLFDFPSLIVDLLIIGLTTYMGFLGGLIGRTKTPEKKLVGSFYLVFTICYCLILNLFFYALVNHAFLAPWELLIPAILASIVGLVSTILMLVQFYRQQAWPQFTLTFFFAGIMTLIYLCSETPSLARQADAPPPLYVPVAPLAYMPPAQVPLAQPSAIDILQQRLARGEIDEATYQRLYTALTRPPQS